MTDGTELLGESFKQAASQLAIDPPHAMMLSGVQGYTPRIEADLLAGLIIGGHGGQVQVLRPEKDKTGISIEQVRGLYQATRSKQASGRAVWQLYLEGASDAAQNALLKLLEEPPLHTVFILVVAHTDSLLQTIRSRSQPLSATPFSPQQAIAWLEREAGLDTATNQQLLFLSEGSATELVHLAGDEQYRMLQLENAAAAKRLVGSPVYDCLTDLNQYGQDRERTLRILHLAIVMLNRLAAAQNSPGILRQLRHYLKYYERIHRNGNVRAQMLAAITARG
ncbi:hypothetical protein JNJ66_03465 [Candidatus Saccharibacteria bacterium]|nr:hypothetical protein [Candidatus Saccharibacteria bacterium]